MTASNTKNTSEYRDTGEINIRAFLKKVWKYNWAVAATSLVTAFVVTLISIYLIRPLYRADFTVFVNNRATNTETNLVSNGDMIAAQSLAYTYSALITNRSVLEPAAEAASMEKRTYAELKKMVTTDIEENTQLINIHVTAPTPEGALAFAEKIAEAAPEYVEGIIEGTSMKIVSAPATNMLPVYPNVEKNAVMGLAAGFIFAIAAMFLHFLLDTKVKDAHELEETSGIALVGSVPRIHPEKKEGSRNGKRKKKDDAPSWQSVLGADTSWEVMEAYRTIRTNVSFMINGKEKKVIGVTSAVPEEGKTTNAINHAISFAQIGKKVLLIDADMRRPSVTGKLGLRTGSGLSNCLAGQKDLSECIKDNRRYGIDILPAGAVPPDPTWMLQSERFEKMIAQVREKYDYIIIDLPPVLTVADAYIISKYVDGYLLVIRNGKTEIKAVEDMVSQLRRAGALVIGFINNDAADGRDSYYRSGYYRTET